MVAPEAVDPPATRGFEGEPALSTRLTTTPTASPYLPSNAGGAVWTINPDANTLAPWAGLAVFCGYAVLSILIAAILMARRDT